MFSLLPKEKHRRSLVLLLLLALGFRLLFLLAMPRVLDTADAIHYVETAEHLAQGDFLGFDPKIPVFYPLLGALVHLLIADMEWACRLISFLASILTVIPVYLLARDLHGAAVARISGLIIAFWPWLADYACRVSTEALAVLLWFSALWLFARGLRRGGWAIYGSTLFFFALSLTRPEGLFLVICTLPGAFLLGWKAEPAILRRYLRFAVISGVLILLNMLFIRLITGTTTANYRMGFILNEFDYIRFIQTTVQSFSNVLPVMLGPLLGIFLGVGFFAARQRTRDLRLESLVLLFATAQWGISLFVLSPAPRYLMTTLIALSLWSACGVVIVSEQIRAARPQRRWLHRIPIAALLLFFLVHGAITVGSEHLGRRPREPREYKEAGQWMAQNLETGLIFTRKPQVGYYAKMPSTGPALDDSLGAALDRARAAKARYLVVDERYTAPMVPSLRPLLEDTAPPPGLERLKTFDTYPDAKVVVYAIVPATSVIIFAH